MRSQISNSSSSSSEITSTAVDWRLKSISAWRMAAAAATSRPQVGCETTSTRGARAISRPTMYFCRLPPDRERAVAVAPVQCTLNRAITSCA